MSLFKKLWNWYKYRYEKVSYRIWLDGEDYIVSVSNGMKTVSCYGNTVEQAKEAALFQLQQLIHEEDHERKYFTKGNGYVLYRVK